MKWERVHGLAAQHSGLGWRYALCCTGPDRGGATCMRNVMLQATMPVGFDFDWLEDTASPVIISFNKWGETYKPLSRLPQQAVQSNIVYQPQEAFVVSTSIAARLTNANR